MIIAAVYAKCTADFASGIFDQRGTEKHCRSYPAKFSRLLWWKTAAKWSKNRAALKIAFHVTKHYSYYCPYQTITDPCIRHFWPMRHWRTSQKLPPAKWNRFLWWKTVAKWSKNRTTLKITFFENIPDVILLLPMSNGLLTSHQAFLTNEALKNIAEVTLQNGADFFDGKPLQNEVKTEQL